MITPGPWRRGIGNEAHTVFDGEGRKVAEHCGYSDGHLIAAAPDMLEALQSVADFYGWNKDGPLGEQGNKVRRAIGLARGGVRT